MLANVEKVEDLQFQENAEFFFQTTSTTVNTYKDPMSRELVRFCQYPIDVENCKCLLSWWLKEQNKFPTLAVLTRHILGILASQIETKHIFSISDILIALCRCHLRTKNMDKLIFVHKNWSFNPRTGCLNHIDVASACEVESNLMAKLEAKFEDQVNAKDSLDLHCVS